MFRNARLLILQGQSTNLIRAKDDPSICIFDNHLINRFNSAPEYRRLPQKAVRIEIYEIQSLPPIESLCAYRILTDSTISDKAD